MRTPVLLVDDDPIGLRMHAAVLQSFGFPSFLAETTDDAIKALKKDKYALVISDVQMPGEGGFDFVRRIVSMGLKDMPILFLTGYDDLEILRGGLRAGGDDFVIKGRPAAWIRKRIAFWLASGFTDLPAELRRRALKAANSLKGDGFEGMRALLEREDRISVPVAKQLQAELKPLGSDYGGRLIERVCFLARLSKLIIDRSETAADYVRFPDYVYFVTQALSPSWQPAFYILLKQFDSWMQDPRFVRAGAEPLKRVQDYSWAHEIDTMLA